MSMCIGCSMMQHSTVSSVFVKTSLQSVKCDLAEHSAICIQGAQNGEEIWGCAQGVAFPWAPGVSQMLCGIGGNW